MFFLDFDFFSDNIIVYIPKGGISLKLFEYIQDYIKIWILPDPWYYFWNDSILGFIILFILAIFISTFIHELGHAFMAKIVGLNVSKMDIGKLRFYNTENGWKLKYVKENSLLYGIVYFYFPGQFMPPDFNFPIFNKKFKLILLGGSLFQWFVLLFIFLNFIIFRNLPAFFEYLVVHLLITSFLSMLPIDINNSLDLQLNDGTNIKLLNDPKHAESYTFYIYLFYYILPNYENFNDMADNEKDLFYKEKVKFVNFSLVEKMLMDKSIVNLYIDYLSVSVLLYIYKDISRAKELIFELEKYLAEIEEVLYKSKSLSEKKKKSWIDKFANVLEEKKNALERIKKDFGELKEIYNRKTANNLKG